MDPTYVRGSGPRQSWAHFPSGAVVQVCPGRARAYPGTPSTAPSTLAFYREASRRFLGSESILDAGCGAGVGTLELSGSFERVFALDNDPHAVAFAREYAPLARYERADLEREAPTNRVDAGVAADVLGHVRSPVAALRTIRGWLGDGGRLFVAEPRATIRQELQRPTRRAFSARLLEATLVNAGFAVSTWVYEGVSFLALVATARPTGEWIDLVRGDAALEAGDTREALAAFGRAARADDSDVRAEGVLSTAFALISAGDLENAAGVLMQASELLPTDARPRAALSRIMLASDSREEALQIATIGVRLDPTLADAAVALALAADALGHPDTPGAWRVAHDLAPDDPFIASELARHACDRGDHAMGVRVFERVRDYGDPMPGAFHVVLARMLLAEGRTTDARLEARIAARLDPGDPDVAQVVRDVQSE